MFAFRGSGGFLSGEAVNFTTALQELLQNQKTNKLFVRLVRLEKMLCFIDKVCELICQLS